MSAGLRVLLSSPRGGILGAIARLLLSCFKLFQRPIARSIVSFLLRSIYSAFHHHLCNSALSCFRDFARACCGCRDLDRWPPPAESEPRRTSARSPTGPHASSDMSSAASSSSAAAAAAAAATAAYDHPLAHPTAMLSPPAPPLRQPLLLPHRSGPPAPFTQEQAEALTARLEGQLAAAAAGAEQSARCESRNTEAASSEKR